MLLKNMDNANKKLFAVVLFHKEQKYSTVPATWVSNDQKFCWWPGPSTKNQSELIRDSNSKPDGTWKTHPITYVKYYGTAFFK
jgi:hypothetical protein